MAAGEVFVYRCMASNTIGEAMSMDVFVTVNGKVFLIFKANSALASVLQHFLINHLRLNGIERESNPNCLRALRKFLPYFIFSL